MASAAIYLDDSAGVFSAMDQMVLEFPDEDRKLADAAIFVGSYYRANGDYEGERRLYRHIARQCHSDSPTFCQQWLKTYSHLASRRGRVVDEELKTLISDDSVNDKMVRYFYWLGNLCHRMGDPERACEMYQAAIDRWPSDGWTLSCRLNQIMIDPALDVTLRQTALDAFVDMFGGHRHYAVAVFRSASDLHRNAMQKQAEGFRQEAKMDYDRALGCSHLVDGDLAARADLFIRQELQVLQADCHYQLGHDEDAITACDVFLVDWSDYANRYQLDMIIACSSQRLMQQDGLEADRIAELGEQAASAYKAIWNSSTNLTRRAKAAQELGRFYIQIGQLEQAAEYLEYFLATGKNWGYARQNAAHALYQIYKQLDKPGLVEDVDKEYFQTTDFAESEIMGVEGRLAVLLGS